MKKYVKPDVVFEGFDLSRHIAGSCTAMLNLSDYFTCKTTGEGDFTGMLPGLFSAAEVCTAGVVDPGDLGGGDYCEFNGSGALVFFKS